MSSLNSEHTEQESVNKLNKDFCGVVMDRMKQYVPHKRIVPNSERFRKTIELASHGGVRNIRSCGRTYVQLKNCGPKAHKETGSSKKQQ
jgi:hypothetical protein